MFKLGPNVRNIMGWPNGSDETKYSQLAVGEQDIGFGGRQLGNDDQFCGNERESPRDCKELSLAEPLRRAASSESRYNSTFRYRFLVGSTCTLTLIFSILQLSILLNRNVHLDDRGETKTKSLDGYKSPSDLHTEWPCGISAEEAKRAGCHFDLGLIAWLPHECYNEELDKSFRTFDSWEFWLPNDENTGPNTSKPITAQRLEELPLQMIDLDFPGHSWSTRLFHDTHCMHAWQYMHQAILKGRKIPASITRFGHTLHCTELALMDSSNITYREISPTAHNRYPTCIDLEILRGEMASS